MEVRNSKFGFQIMDQQRYYDRITRGIRKVLDASSSQIESVRRLHIDCANSNGCSPDQVDHFRVKVVQIELLASTAVDRRRVQAALVVVAEGVVQRSGDHNFWMMQKKMMVVDLGRQQRGHRRGKYIGRNGSYGRKEFGEDEDDEE